MTQETEKKSQKQKFMELAKEADCDEDEEVFDAKLKKIASRDADAPPKKEE